MHIDLYLLKDSDLYSDLFILGRFFNQWCRINKAKGANTVRVLTPFLLLCLFYFKITLPVVFVDQP